MTIDPSVRCGHAWNIKTVKTKRYIFIKPELGLISQLQLVRLYMLL